MEPGGGGSRHARPMGEYEKPRVVRQALNERSLPEVGAGHWRHCSVILTPAQLRAAAARRRAERR